MIILRIRVEEVDTVLTQYDKIRVYKDSDVNGSFLNVNGTVNLVAGTSVYDYVDPTGTSSDYYKVSYYNSTTEAETQKSAAFHGGPITGPLGLATPDYIKTHTDLTGLSTLADSKVAVLIYQAETLIQIYANRRGGLNTGAVGYATLGAMIVQLVVEELWMRNQPNIRMAQAGGIVQERIGNYSYTARKIEEGTLRDFRFTNQIETLLKGILHTSESTVNIHTTVVFPEAKPVETVLTPQLAEQSIRLWHDKLDLELYYPPLAWIDD